MASWAASPRKAEHLRRGQLGEDAAKRMLVQRGMKFLAANFAGDRGEIDLVFRDGDCLAFVEVKTRSSEDWSRPASAVTREKQRKISKTAFDYLAKLDQPRAAVRFDIVEVLLDQGSVREMRYLPNAFPLSRPYRIG